MQLPPCPATAPNGSKGPLKPLTVAATLGMSRDVRAQLPLEWVQRQCEMSQTTQIHTTHAARPLREHSLVGMCA
jgi:hypothetical protein